MTKQELENITPEAQKIIRAYLKKTGKTESGLAREANVHPAQLLLFMRNERGLTLHTLKNIARVINGKKPVENPAKK